MIRLRAIPKHRGATYVQTRATGWNHSPNVAQQEYFDVTLKAPVILPEDDNLDIGVIPVMPPLDWNGVRIKSFLSVDNLAADNEFDVDIRAGDFIAAPGFTSMPAVTTDRPVLLTGIVASDPRFPVLVTPAGFTSQAVLYQSLSRSGLSGAPIFAPQRELIFGDGLEGPPHRPMRLVGVNAGSFTEQSLPLQFSYFTRSSDVLDLISTV